MSTQTMRPFLIEDATAVLSRTPGVLSNLLQGLPESWIAATEGGATWSPFDVVGHLLHGERTDWMPRVRLILEHGEGRPFDRFDRFAQATTSKAYTLGELLDQFAEERSTNLASLAGLCRTEQDLDRCGRHPELGVVTLRQLLATWVAHDLDHIVQVSRTMARQYADEVGPWRAYLRIISGTQG